MRPRPRYRVYVLVSGPSYALLQHVKEVGLELDRASGSHVDLVAIGDREQSGDCARASWTSEELAVAPLDAARYVKLVTKGRESWHVVRQSAEQAKLLGLGESDVPCLALVDLRTAGLLASSALEPGWYESEAGRRAVVRTMVSGLAGAPLVAAFTAGGETSTSAAVMEFRRLATTISWEVVRATGDDALASGLRIPDGTVLYSRSVEGDRLFFLYGQPVHLGKVPAAFLRALMLRPNEFLSLDDLAGQASPRSEDAGFNPVKWGKDTKLAVMRALKKSAGSETSGDVQAVIKQLIVVKSGAYRLNLRPDQVWLS